MLYDISPPIDERLAVWPGDTPPTRDVLLDRARGDSVTLSTLRATVHLGAHADAPSHYGPGAATIDQRPLELYLGPCEVVHVRVKRRQPVRPADLPEGIEAPRVLIRTGTAPDRTLFATDLAPLTPELIDWLADRGVRLVGVDTPSVDPVESKDLPAHAVCLRRDVAILEGLDLGAVPPGRYELIALPLRLAGFDASPVRAVLRDLVP